MLRYSYEHNLNASNNRAHACTVFVNSGPKSHSRHAPFRTQSKIILLQNRRSSMLNVLTFRFQGYRNSARPYVQFLFVVIVYVLWDYIIYYK